MKKNYIKMFRGLMVAGVISTIYYAFPSAAEITGERSAPPPPSGMYDIIFGGTCDNHDQCIPNSPVQCLDGWNMTGPYSAFREKCMKGSSCIGYYRCVESVQGTIIPLFEKVIIAGESVPLYPINPPVQ